MKWGRGVLLSLLCAVAVGASLGPRSASATNDPLSTHWSTTLSVDRSFQRLLSAHGVSLLARQGASRRGTTYSLPVTGGALDPTLGQGEIEQGGSLVFQRGKRSVIVRQIAVKTKTQPLIAKVGGGQLKLASGAQTSFERDGFVSIFSARRMLLSKKFATRLAKKLRLHGVFEGGQPLGALRSLSEPSTTAILPLGRVSITPDPAFMAKLDSLFISLNPVAPAERASGPIFSLPFIPSGTIAPDASSGVPRSGGSLEFLQLGAGQIFWHELWFDLANHTVLAEVDIEPTPTFPGKLGQIPILSLGAGVPISNPKARTVSLAGAQLSLNSASAAHFNSAFAGGKETFHAGELLGTLNFTAQTQ